MTTTDDRELFSSAASYDAAKREIVEGRDVYKLWRNPSTGRWTGSPVSTWDTLERTLDAIVTAELGRHHPDKERRRTALRSMALGCRPVAEADAAKVATIRSARLADERRRERAREIAGELNRGESLAMVAGAAAGV